MKFTSTIIVAIGALCVASTVMAQSMEDCRTIKDAQERLACFDAGGKTGETTRSEQGAPSPERRRAFAANVRRLFLARGQDFLVIVDEIQPAHRKDRTMYTEQKGIGYPRLYVSGVTSDPWLFQIMTKTDLLKSARAAGFIAAEFDNQLGGKRFFDLRAGVPACDTAVFVCR